MFQVIITATAEESIKGLRARDRAAVVGEIERVLTVNPTLESKARVKKLRQPARAQFRLRVGDFRVYDADASRVIILNAVHKRDVEYLEQDT